MRRTSLLLLLLLLATASPTLADDPAPTLRGGAAVVDVSPTKFPVNLPGGFSGNAGTFLHDKLHSRALVLSNGETTIALVVVDNLGVDPNVIEKAKKLASEGTDIPVDHMLVCSTHTHSAPTSSTTKGPIAEVEYAGKLTVGISDSIVDAHEAMGPVAVGHAVEPLAEEVFNRRWFLKPGKMPANPFGGLDLVKMNPPRRPDTLDRPAGPTDPDITILSVEDEAKRPLALFANYSLHYVGGVPRGQVSADYFGEFARLMRSRLRAPDDFVAMMSNGTSGDINNIPFTVTRPPREPYEQIGIVARKAADTAWFAHRKIEKHESDVPLAMVERVVTLEYRKPTEKEIAAAEDVLAKWEDESARAKLPRLADHYARRTLKAAERPKTVDVKLQAIRVGDLAICGIPFETFVEIGLELKAKSPFETTMVVGLANGRHGYLPTPEQHRLGGYETWLGTNIVQKDASVVLVKHLREMLDELNE